MKMDWKPSIILLCILFACNQQNFDVLLANHPEINTFLNHFFVPDTSFIKVKTDNLFLDEPSGYFKDSGTCSSDQLCNSTKEYYLQFTPNFMFERENVKIIVSGADPDSFVDLADVKESKYFRVSQMGTMGSIYGTFWLTDFSFVAYGMIDTGGFIELFDINERTIQTYKIDNSRRKEDADLDSFLISKYGNNSQMY